MDTWHYRFKRVYALFFAILGMNLITGTSSAQPDAQATAIAAVRSAMDAYSNLNIDEAKTQLEETLALAADLNARTLARIYTSLGMVWSGGFSEPEKGQENFKIAVCLDGDISVDPLYLTPEIETEFNLAKLQVTPEACEEILSDVVLPADFASASEETPAEEPSQPTPSIAPCGDHMPITEQKQKHELPFYLELSSEFESNVDRLVVKYAFDASPDYTEIELKPTGDGVGALLTCDQGQIRVFDPASISYFIEGTDVTGQVVCGHGIEEAPIQILMMPDAQPLPAFGDLRPKECAPCPPWDETCAKKDALPGRGEVCSPTVGCQIGLVCSDLNVCEKGWASAGPKDGPSKFYVNVGGGGGVGYFKKDWQTRIWDGNAPNRGAPGPGAIVIKDQGGGFAWSGIPVRLAVGFFVTPDLSLEVSGRFDVYVVSVNNPTSCWDQVGGVPSGNDISCDPSAFPDPELVDPQSDAQVEAYWKRSIALRNDGSQIWTSEYQYAWIVNARARYRVLKSGPMGISLFGGAGYGQMQFRVPSDETNYFPMTGMVNVELGPALSFFFNNHVGLQVELPIDFLFGDGFSVNADLVLGMGIGF
ncbi:MAG: hypothetical protein QNJ97_08995 [Myxococcota bacterium]|nr:hypothetical protein [Myxococcota bacterium]